MHLASIMSRYIYNNHSTVPAKVQCVANSSNFKIIDARFCSTANDYITFQHFKVSLFTSLCLQLWRLSLSIFSPLARSTTLGNVCKINPLLICLQPNPLVASTWYNFGGTWMHLRHL